MVKRLYVLMLTSLLTLRLGLQGRLARRLGCTVCMLGIGIFGQRRMGILCRPLLSSCACWVWFAIAHMHMSYGGLDGPRMSCLTEGKYVQGTRILGL